MYRSVIVNVLRSFNDGIFCADYVHIDIYYLMVFLARMRPRGERSARVRAYLPRLYRVIATWPGWMAIYPELVEGHLMFTLNAPDQASCTHGSYWVE
jgi:hypothetical protein